MLPKKQIREGDVDEVCNCAATSSSSCNKLELLQQARAPATALQQAPATALQQARAPELRCNKIELPGSMQHLLAVALLCVLMLLDAIYR
jgi:hypothetical protein